MEKVIKIAIIKVSSIGDIAHTAHIPHIIKKNIKNAEIHWFCDETFTDILSHHQYIDFTHPVISKNAKNNKIGFIKQLFKLKKQFKNQFDYTLDLQGTFKTALIGRFLCNNKNLWGFKYTRDKLAPMLYKQHCNTKLQTNIHQRVLELTNNALQIDAKLSDVHLPFLSTPHTYDTNPDGILIFPSSSRANKNYGMENFSKIIQNIHNHNITLLYGNKAEQKLCNEIQSNVNLTQNKNINIVGGLSLNKVKNLIASHKCVIGGDTGILHIASALGVKNITLYGPTSSYRTNIHMPHSIALQGIGAVNTIPPQTVINSLISFNL